MTPELLKQLKQHTIECYPNEACGLIVGDLFVPIGNVAPHPRGSFIMCPVQLADALDRFEPTAIFHSHPDDTAAPSAHDTARINRADTPLPWVIMSWPEYDVTTTYPTQLPKLIGRTFTHGVNDCYTLIKDFTARSSALNCATITATMSGGKRGKTYTLTITSRKVSTKCHSMSCNTATLF